MTAETAISRYEQAHIALRACTPTTAIYRAAVDAREALLDHVRRHGPVLRDSKVYAEHEGRLLVLVGVRTAEEMDREATNRSDCDESV